MTAGRPEVSIVIPLFNGGRFIGRTLDAVLGQTFGDLEVIVVDDGSDDEGPDIVATVGDPRVVLVRKPHAGIAATRNLGASLASPHARFLVFLDQDDIWKPSFLERTREALTRRPEASGAFALADFMDAEDVWADDTFSAYMRDRPGVEHGRVVERPSGADVDLTQVFVKNPVYPPSCLLVRRSVFDEVGGRFDAGFRVADDWDMIVRLARRGPLIALDDVLVGYRRHGQNASLNTPRNVRETRLLWATARYSADNSPADVSDLDLMWRWHQRRSSARKRAEAMSRLRTGHVIAALRTAADALAHLVLRRPLRSWLGYRQHEADAPFAASDVVVQRATAQ